jgi:hypothetical protein
MCPACLSTVALMAAGATSSGGLSALFLQTLRTRRRARRSDLKPEATEIEPCSTTASYRETSGSRPASSI